MNAVDTAALAANMIRAGMFPNARVLPTTGDRLAVVVRETAGAPWRQVEAIIGLEHAARYADELNVSENDRMDAFNVSEAVAWDSNERALFPMFGTVWTHRNGNLYIVENIVNLMDDDRYPCSVVYRGENGMSWSRVFTDWYRSMTFQADSMPLLHGAPRDWWTVDYRKNKSA